LTIHFEIRRRAAVASAISASCWSPGIWAANAPISMRSILASRVGPAFPRARRVWDPCRQVGDGIQEPRCLVGESNKSSTLPSGSASSRLRLGVPVDPADVRKVVLEEPPGSLPLNDEMVKKARARLFGSWEMNWMAYNFAHDVTLPGSSGAPLGFFMYPQAETTEGRLDCLDPDGFKYEITSREIAPASS